MIVLMNKTRLLFLRVFKIINLMRNHYLNVIILQQDPTLVIFHIMGTYTITLPIVGIYIQSYLFFY